MSPAKSRKSSKAKKAAGKAGKASRKPGKSPGKAASRKGASKTAKKAKSSKTGRAKPTASATGHAHCAATDPFGDTCQNLPRRPSKYCVIHSYLDR